jgi:MoxR-like ATPase
MTPAEIVAAREVVDDIYIDDKIKDYIVDLVLATREPAGVRPAHGGLDPVRRLAARHDRPDRRRAGERLPGGPRLRHPQDVKDVAPDVLRHRVIVTYEAEAEEKTAESIIKEILDHLPVP